MVSTFIPLFITLTVGLVHGYIDTFRLTPSHPFDPTPSPGPQPLDHIPTHPFNRYCVKGRGFNPVIEKASEDPYMLNPGTTLKAGNLRLYPHNWLEVNVVLQDKRHTVVLIDPTISQFSEDISEDIAVWYESMPGYDDAIEKYWPGEHLEYWPGRMQDLSSLNKYMSTRWPHTCESW